MKQVKPGLLSLLIQSANAIAHLKANATLPLEIDSVAKNQHSAVSLLLCTLAYTRMHTDLRTVHRMPLLLFSYGMMGGIPRGRVFGIEAAWVVFEMCPMSAVMFECYLTGRKKNGRSSQTHSLPVQSLAICRRASMQMTE